MKATFCKTKAGNGFKIIVDNKWLYASKDKLLAVIDGDARSCRFGEMDNSSEEDETECKFESPFDENSSEDEFQYVGKRSLPFFFFFDSGTQNLFFDKYYNFQYN